MKSNNKINVIFVFSVYDLPISALQSIIYAYIQDFMLILSEMLKIALNYAKICTIILTQPNMIIYTPIESPSLI